MKAPNNFNALSYINNIANNYTMVETYFCRDQLELMDSIDDLYNKLDVDNVMIPLTTVDLLEKE